MAGKVCEKEKRLSGTEREVLALVVLSSKIGNGLACSKKDLASYTGRCTKTIDRAVSVLKKLELIEVQLGFDSFGGQTENTYLSTEKGAQLHAELEVAEKEALQAQEREAAEKEAKQAMAREAGKTAPTASLEQRRIARKNAYEARKKRQQVRDKLRDGQISIEEVLLMTDDDAVGRMQVKLLLEAYPGVGTARSRSILKELGIPETRRLRGLGVRQREALISKGRELASA